jgi:hypothetical protein
VGCHHTQFAFCNPIHGIVTVCTNDGPLSSFRQVKELSSEAMLPHNMTIFVYRCPNTGKKVQGWTDDPPVADDAEAYQSVKCVACARLHWVNPRTGRVLEPTEKHRRS